MRATVIIPTFDHGPLLKYSVQSAINQTVADIEIFIVGDGVPKDLRDGIARIVGSDPRIRFFDFEKGARHGEVWRHEVIDEAKGKIVCYLSDDDLWMPHHLEVMEELLRDADFANTLPVHADVTGELNTYVVDLELSGFHDLFREGHNRVPLTCAGHTIEAYGRSSGWRTTPEGLPTDLYMWQEFLRHPENRVKSGFRPTSINFPSPWRRDWPLAQRETELRAWWQRILDPEQCARIPILIIETQARLAARSFLDNRQFAERVIKAESEASQWHEGLREATHRIGEMEHLIEELKTEAASLRARLEDSSSRLQSSETLGDRARRELESTSAELRRIERVHYEMAHTATWRIREGVMKVPLIGSTVRWVARALTRGQAR